jgi:hypothetical protein
MNRQKSKPYHSYQNYQQDRINLLADRLAHQAYLNHQQSSLYNQEYKVKKVPSLLERMKTNPHLPNQSQCQIPNPQQYLRKKRDYLMMMMTSTIVISYLQKNLHLKMNQSLIL